MFTLMLAVAVTASTSNGVYARSASEARPCSLTRTCVNMGSDAQRLRLSESSAPRYDVKMDAYRVDSRPCRLIGDMRCPIQAREIFRVGEPIRETLARSFGLD